MYISNVVIKNFRVIEDLNFELNPRVNVIAGPNATGKTTILQALRLVKALIAPRTQNEAQQTLMSLGAASPHFPQRVFIGSLANDINKPIEIRCTYRLGSEEINCLEQATDHIVRGIVLSNLGQPFVNPTAIIQYFGSEAGKEASKQAMLGLRQALDRLKSDNAILVGLRLDPQSGNIAPAEPITGNLIAFLDQRLPPHLTVFSTFPADRALPVGEVGVQLGAADAQQQLEAHNSQPHLKFARLKNMIFNSSVLGQHERESIINEFDRIFSAILKGRRISRMGLNEIGLLSVMIEDIETRRMYEIDSLSSGEKGLALTLLLIATSVSFGGIVLLDEPELHLNPAICKDVLGFMLDSYSLPREIQFIICTHSPEILSGAFNSDHCFLHHIVSGNTISRVGHKNIGEYSTVLHKLGTSVSESLLYRGTIFVEGVDDVEFLNVGFNSLLRRYKIKDLGGRREVEKAARSLQEIENKGEHIDPIFLIIDGDDQITDIRNSRMVRLLQWRRRCMENYLIDLDIISDLFRDTGVVSCPIATQGEVTNRIRNLAMSQIEEICIWKIYRNFGYRGPLVFSEDISGRPVDDVAEILVSKITVAKNALTLGDTNLWKSEFIREVSAENSRLSTIWETKWKEYCDGKRLFADLKRSGLLRVSSSAIKKKIIERMRISLSDDWRAVESMLKQLLEGGQMQA